MAPGSARQGLQKKGEAPRGSHERARGPSQKGEKGEGQRVGVHTLLPTFPENSALDWVAVMVAAA
jgi:hypothetical protein